MSRLRFAPPGFPDETPPRPLPALPPSRAARTESRDHDRTIHLRPARPRRQTPSNQARSPRRRSERTRAGNPAHRSQNLLPRPHGARAQAQGRGVWILQTAGGWPAPTRSSAGCTCTTCGTQRSQAVMAGENLPLVGKLLGHRRLRPPCRSSGEGGYNHRRRYATPNNWRCLLRLSMIIDVTESSRATPSNHPSPTNNLLETKPMKSINIPLVTFIVAICLVVSSLASAQSTLDIDEQRAATLKKLESDFPDPDEIRRVSKETFSKPISAQDIDVLQSLAKQSNGYANMVNFVKDEYDDYRRENYSYDFVLEKLKPSLGHYARIVNEFLAIRNQAYFNLGMKEKEAGNNVSALLWFRDAFRLSSFDCGKNQARETCMRWKAEQELQALLGLSSIRAYVTWQ